METCRSRALSQMGATAVSESSTDAVPCAAPAVQAYTDEPANCAAMVLRTVCGASVQQTADLMAGGTLQGNPLQVELLNCKASRDCQRLHGWPGRMVANIMSSNSRVVVHRPALAWMVAPDCTRCLCGCEVISYQKMVLIHYLPAYVQSL